MGAALQPHPHGFDSPFKAEVYFVSTRQVTDLKWGTPNPVMMRDVDFGPIRLRAFGTYTLRATDPKALLRELVGTDSEFTSDEITELLRSIISTALADILGTSQIAALDLASNYNELSEKLRLEVCERVDDEYGLDIPQLYIVNISLPEEVEKAIDTRSSMGVIGDLDRFQQFQFGKAMTAAAENPAGGGAADGMGIGLGFAMANRMMPGAGAVAQPAVPPPPPQAAWHVVVNGQTEGPFTDQQIAQGIASGQLGAATMVWSAGMPNWSPAGQTPQLTGYFAAATPPPPPPAS